MKRFNHLVALVSLLVFVVAMIAPAMATESSDESPDETTDTTAEPVQISEGEQPAIVAPPIEEGDADEPWTARFIYPLIVLGTFVLIIGIAIGYNRSVRTKYQVVG
jgi:hypothetical protein